MEKVMVRRALHCDYEAVMAINRDIEEGMDYLPITYHHFINHAHCYVAEVEKQVVSFMCFCIVDAGLRIVNIAGRTLHTFQKTGVTSKLYNQSMTHLSKEYPRVNKTSGTSINLPLYERLQNDPQKNIHINRKWNVLTYRYPSEDMAKLVLGTSCYADVQKLDKAGIHELYTNNQHLFGNYPYIEALINWFPLSVSITSLEQVEREGHIAISYSSPITEIVSSDCSKQVKHQSNCNMISFSSSYRTPSGMHVLVHVREGKTCHNTVLTQHILFHMHRAQKVAPESGDIQILIDIPYHTDRVIVEKELLPLLGQCKTSFMNGVSADTDLSSKL